MFIDMHTHEELFSPCSVMRLEEAVVAARYAGLDGLCVTDHNSTDIRAVAADYLRREDFPVFVGVEFSTAQGDIVAFGLEELPEPWLTPAQTFIDLVNDREGFCFAAHPFRSYGGGLDRFTDKLTGLHGLETFNGGNIYQEDNLRAARVCRRLGLIPVAGSDAHCVENVGTYATWFPQNITSERELILALLSGQGRPVHKTGKSAYAFIKEEPEYKKFPGSF